MKEQKKIHHILQSGDEAKEIKHFTVKTQEKGKHFIVRLSIENVCTVGDT